MCKDFKCNNSDEKGRCPDSKNKEGWTYCTKDSCSNYSDCSMCKHSLECFPRN